MRIICAGINNTTTDDIKSQVIQVLAENLNFSCNNSEVRNKN